jgi:hypothetical protein
MLTDQSIAYKTTNHIRKLRANSSLVNRCFDSLEKEGDLILFGGAVRDILVNHAPRDYDVVVAIDNNKLDRIVNTMQLSSRRNRFGGYSMKLDGHLLDVWSLESTWAFREKFISPSVSNLTETVFFNIDSIAVNLSNEQVYASKFLEALQTKFLDIILESNPYPDLCVLRAFVFEKRKQLRFSEQLIEYISKWVNSTVNPVNTLIEVQQKHYGFDALDMTCLKKDVYRFC